VIGLDASFVTFASGPTRFALENLTDAFVTNSFLGGEDVGAVASARSVMFSRFEQV